MKMQELVQEAQAELDADRKTIAKEVLKERMQELEAAEKSLATLKAQYTELLNSEVSDVVNA